MILPNGVMFTTNVSATSNILQYPFDTTYLTTVFSPTTATGGYLVDQYSAPVIDSASYYLLAGTVTTTLTVAPQILLADGTWANVSAPQTNTGAAVAQTVTLATGQEFNGSFNVLAATAGQPSILVPFLGIRLAVTITSATLSKAMIVFTKR